MKSKDRPVISVIIPVVNEAENLRLLIPGLASLAHSPEELEVIVVDGGSSDPSVATASSLGAVVLSSPKGRACQMNAGARVARGKMLYFLHADSLPPENFDKLILEAVEQGVDAGCFRLEFDSPSMFLSFFAWFSRFNLQVCRGGDQSLFITSELFNSLGGFDERYRVYEDNEFAGRIYRAARFRVLPQKVRTSARKYALNGRYKLQYHFARIHFLYFMGREPEALYAYYKKHIRQV